MGDLNMTRREEMAKELAVAIILSEGTPAKSQDPESVAQRAVKFADELLAALDSAAAEALRDS